jgi:hypothetical protein
MKADISIWRKPGHFYLALTRRGTTVSLQNENPLNTGPCYLYTTRRASSLLSPLRSLFEIKRRT